MVISARSHLLAGTFAVVTATAVTATGMTATGVDLPSARISAAASVKLAAYASPLLEIYDTIQKAQTYLFSIADYQQAPPPAPQTGFTYYGMIPDWLGVGFPAITQYILNASDYINLSLNYMFQDYPYPSDLPTPPVSTYPGALRLLTWAAQALPANIGYAANQLFSGNLYGVLDTLKFAVVNPIQAALYQTLNSGMYVVGGVLARTAAVVTAIAEWIPDAIRHLADDVTVVGNAAFRVLRDAAYGIQTANPEIVWNSLVVGLLGTGTPYYTYDPARPTVPDALINQTFGAGGRLYSVPPNPLDPSQPGVYEPAPSIREDLTTLRDNIAEALATDVPAPAEPPFPVNFQPVPPQTSQIPTPWQQTPPYYPPPAPFAAVRTPAAAAQAAVARSTVAKAKARGAAARAAAR